MSILSQTAPTTRQVLAHLRDPLFRTGDLLIVNAGVNAALGMLFWVGAAHRYSRADVGTNAAAISAMMLLAGFAQLNLMSAMVRFVPTAGHGTRRLVASAYAVSVLSATVFSVVFLLGIRLWAPGLARVLDHWPVAPWFVLATCAWCVFVLQDAVLTGLGRPGWVPLENGVFSLAKMGLVVVLFAVLPHYGVFTAWTIAVFVPTIPVNVFIFRRAIPAHVAEAHPTHRAPTVRELSRFLAGDYVAALAWISATALLPVIVLDRLGARPTASFSTAWAVGLALFMVSSSMGQSLVVRGAKDEAQLTHHSRRALTHALGLLVPAVAVVFVVAPSILRIFGTTYALQGTALLRYMALASLPTLYVTLVVSELRVHRRVLRVAAIMVALAALVLTLSYTLIDHMGITAIGIAWLVGEGTVALALVAMRLWPSRTVAPAVVGPAIDMPLLEERPSVFLNGKDAVSGLRALWAPAPEAPSASAALGTAETPAGPVRQVGERW
jgi:O-antigen/teichoic acid export membrane protein